MEELLCKTDKRHFPNKNIVAVLFLFEKFFLSKLTKSDRGWMISMNSMNL